MDFFYSSLELFSDTLTAVLSNEVLQILMMYMLLIVVFALLIMAIGTTRRF